MERKRCFSFEITFRFWFFLGSVMSLAAGGSQEVQPQCRVDTLMVETHSNAVNHNVSPAEGKYGERKHCEQRTAVLCDRPSVFFNS